MCKLFDPSPLRGSQAVLVGLPIGSLWLPIGKPTAEVDFAAGEARNLHTELTMLLAYARQLPML